MDNQKQNENLRFPPRSHLIIFELLKKYGLEETDNDCFKKIIENKKTLRETVARAIRSVAEGNTSINQLPEIFKKELGLDKEKAKNLAGDLQKEILAHTTGLIVNELDSTQSLQKNISEKKPLLKKEKDSVPDAYRETT